MIEIVGGEAAEQLARLHCGAFPRPWSADEIAKLLANPNAFALMADAEGRAIGFVLAWAIGADAEILTLAVSPEARRRGVGAELVLAACALSGSRGAKGMCLDVADDNAPALGLYRKLGFAEIARRRGYYANGADALILRRNLAAPQD